MTLLRRSLVLPLLAVALAAACGRRAPALAAEAGPLDAAAGPEDVAPLPAVDAAGIPDDAAVDVPPKDAVVLPSEDARPAPPLEGPRPREAADLARLERLCGEGDGLACLRAASVLAEGRFGTASDPPRAARLWQRACGQGRAEGCRRLGIFRLTAAGDAARTSEGIDLLDRSCELGSLVACVALGDLHLHGAGIAMDVYRSLLAYQKACNGGYAGACVAVQGARQLAESYDLPLPRVREPESPKQPPAPETVCPPLLDGALDAGGGERLDRGLRPLAAETLAAAMPAEIPGWTLAARGAVEDRIAEQRGAAAWTSWTSDGRTVAVVVRDRLGDCTLQPGTGTAMRTLHEAFTSPPRAVRCAGLDAAVVDGAAGRELRLWLGDRCTVVVRGGGAAGDEDLKAVVERLELAALGRACARREGDGLPP
jgi:TPR repeat protein